LHWHEFARDLFRLTGRAKRNPNENLFDAAAVQIAANCKVLLLDEILITSVVDAMSLKGLFQALWARGVTTVVTSSTKPADLFANNKEWEDFLPELSTCAPMFDFTVFGITDHRLSDLEESTHHFVSPINEETSKQLETMQQDLIHDTGSVKSDQIFQIPGESRTKTVPKSGVAADGTKFAQFDFHELFDEPLGRAIYSALAIEYDHLFIMNAPKMAGEDNSQFRRFYTFVDLVYGKKGNLYLQTEVDAADIYEEPSEEAKVDHHAWWRNREMLNEMRTPKYQMLSWLARNHMVQSSATKLVQ